MVAAVASDDPQTSPNSAQAATVAEASPPRQWPISVERLIDACRQTRARGEGPHHHEKRDDRQRIAGRGDEGLGAEHEAKAEPAVEVDTADDSDRAHSDGHGNPQPYKCPKRDKTDNSCVLGGHVLISSAGRGLGTGSAKDSRRPQAPCRPPVEASTSPSGCRWTAAVAVAVFSQHLLGSEPRRSGKKAERQQRRNNGKPCLCAFGHAAGEDVDGNMLLSSKTVSDVRERRLILSHE